MSRTSTTIQEQIVREGKLQARFGMVLDQGKGVLTPQHFYYQTRAALWLRFFGFVGVMVRNAFQLKVKIDIPLSSITAIGRGRLGMSRNVFFIETVEGKKYQFGLDYQFWLDALKDVLQKQAGTVLVQSNPECWTVQR